MTRLRLLGNTETIKNLLNYYGKDTTVMEVLSANLTPIQQKELDMLGPCSWAWKGAI